MIYCPKNCPKRSQICHINCNTYKTACIENEKIKAKRRADARLNGFHFDVQQKAMNIHHKNKLAEARRKG